MTADRNSLHDGVAVERGWQDGGAEVEGAVFRKFSCFRRASQVGRVQVVNPALGFD